MYELNQHNEAVFDEFLLRTKNKSLSDCIEEVFLVELRAKEVVFWHDIVSLHVLYSKTKNRIVSHSDGLVGYAFYQRKNVIIPVPCEHPAYKRKFDYCPADNNLAILMFPLYDNKGNIMGIVQVYRDKKDEFNCKKEMDFISYFSSKFCKLFSLFESPPTPDGSILDLLMIMELEQFLLIFQKKMDELFKCRVAEIWSFDKTAGEIIQYKKSKAKVNPEKAGIVGDVMHKMFPFNCVSNRMQSSYCEDIDGSAEEPVIIIPKCDIKNNIVYAICLRGGKESPAFTTHHFELLKVIAPFAFLAIQNLESISNSSLSKDRDLGDRQCIEGLKEIMDLISTKNDQKLMLQQAVEKMELIAHADKSTWFSIDKNTNRLKTEFCTQKNFPSHLVSNLTIPARVYATREVFNIADAYEDIEFDSSIDLETGYRTTSLLAIPILNGKYDIVGVAEFCNRHDGKPFPNSIIPYIQILSLFIQLLLDTEELHKQVLEASKSLRHFLNISLSLSTDVCLQQLHTNILHTIRVLTNSESGAIFLFNEEKNVLSSFVADGSKIQLQLPLKYGLAALAFKMKEPVIANDAQSDPRYVKDPLDMTGVIINSVCIVPIVTFSGTVLGVIEIANKEGNNFDPADCEKVKSLAVLVAISLEDRNIENIAEHGNCDFEINRWIEETEKPELPVPAKMKIVTTKQLELNSIDFDRFNWEGIDFFRIIYYLFNVLNLVSMYKIKAEVLFSFIYKARETYNDFPFHNWEKAVDNLQLLVFMIKMCKLQTKISAIELLSLCVSSLFIESGYEEHPEDYATESLEIAGNLLHQGKSQEQAKRCAFAINVLSQPESNIMKSLSQEDLKTAWNTVMRLIMSTEMTQHFNNLIFANKIEDESDDFHDESKKQICLTLMLRVSMMAFMFRPQMICEKWYDQISEELRLEKQVESKIGMFDSQKVIEKTKMTARYRNEFGYATTVAMPTIRALVRLMPKLSPMYELAEANFERWKEFFYIPPVLEDEAPATESIVIKA